MNLFSDKEVNLGRQEEMDLARGFSIILVVIVHVGLYLGNDIDRGLWVFCDIAGSEPCAPVFMALMGISMAYSRRQNPADLLKRGICLFLLGYALNLFRSLLPFIILGNIDEWASVEAFFVVDILQLAGLSFMLIALLRKIKLPSIAIFAISVVMVYIDQFIMLPETVSWNSEIVTGLANLFYPITEWSCFPFLTWFIFPAFGVVYGEMLTRCINKNKLYGIFLPVGFCGTFYVYYKFYLLYPDYVDYYWGNNYYYMGVKNTLLTLMIICFYLSICFFAERILPDIVKRWLEFLSKNINTYYIISWILISILIHVQALCDWDFGTWITIALMIILIVICKWLVNLWVPLKRKISRRK